VAEKTVYGTPAYVTGVMRSGLRNCLTSMVGSVFTPDQMNRAINLAIAAAWPTIKQTKQDTSLTLVAGTYTYTPAATDITDQGIAQIHVTQAGEAPVLLRRWTAHRATSLSWVISFPSDTVGAYGGSGLVCLYHTPYPRLDEDGSATDLVFAYIVHYAAAILAIEAQQDADHFNVEGYRQTAGQWMQLAQQVLKQNATPALPVYAGAMKQ